MKLCIFSRLAAAAAVMALAFAPAAEVVAQTYPYQTPTYIPSAVLAPSTLAIAGDVTFVTNGISTVSARITGTNTGVVGVFQGTNETGSSPTWTTIPAHPIGGGVQTPTITGNGFWRVGSAGFAKVRFHMTAISTGSVVVAMTGTPAPLFLGVSPVRKATYSAAVTALAPAASATDFFTLTGSATTTVKITKVECSGISTANATATVNALLRSTANTGGTSSAATAVPSDSTNLAASATALGYTANPTTGTLIGVIRSGKLTTNTAASSTISAPSLTWTFGDGQNQEATLRGIAQVFALNGAGASFTAGAALNCSVTWTEE